MANTIEKSKSKGSCRTWKAATFSLLSIAFVCILVFCLNRGQHLDGKNIINWVEYLFGSVGGITGILGLVTGVYNKIKNSDYKAAAEMVDGVIKLIKNNSKDKKK